MYQYTIPSPISEKDITKLAQKFVGKKKCQIILLWVPYQTLECTIQTFEGTIENTKTALNIMFREDYLSERDLILMFRPNFLKYPKIDHKPSNLNKFLRRLSEKEVQSEEINYETLAKKITFFSETIQKELTNLNSAMKDYKDTSIMSRMFFPSSKELIRLFSRETREINDFIEKEYARLVAMRVVIKMALNTKVYPQKINFKEGDKFFHPYLVIVSNREVFFIDLVKRGKLLKKFMMDPVLSRVTRENENARKKMLQILE